MADVNTNKVLFKFGTKAQYLALTTKDPNALYFISDTGELFKGSVAIAQNNCHVKTSVAELNVVSGLKLGDIGIVKSGNDVLGSYIYDGSAWQSLGTAGAVSDPENLVFESNITYLPEGEEGSENAITIETEGKNLPEVLGQVIDASLNLAKDEISNAVNSLTGDGVSIAKNEDIFSLKGFNETYFQWVEGESGEGSYEEMEPVNGQFPAGLIPKTRVVDGQAEIAWYMPRTASSDELLEAVETLTEKVASFEFQLDDEEEGSLANEVAALKDWRESFGDSAVSTIKINGEVVNPEDGVVDITIPTAFDGSAAGLVPVPDSSIGEAADTYFLNANGEWVQPEFEDARVGDLSIDGEEYDSVADYVEAYMAKHADDNALYWGAIEELEENVD